MTFRANSMTFKIDPNRWPAMSNYHLREEFDEFFRWFGFNVSAMNKREANDGWKLIKQLKELMEERGIDTTQYMYVDSASGSDSQISFFTRG